MLSLNQTFSTFIFSKLLRLGAHFGLCKLFRLRLISTYHQFLVFLPGKIGVFRRMPYADHMASVLGELPHRKWYPPATKNEAKLDCGRGILRGETCPLYPRRRRICVDGITKVQKNKFWSRSGPTNRD